MNEKNRKHLTMLKERLEKEIASLQENLEELKNDLKEASPIKNEGLPKILTSDNGMVRTGQFWYKNRFKPEEGYAIGRNYRILYELQDEGPAFIGQEFGWFNCAKEYVEKHSGMGTVYRIISPEGEIVK